MKNVTLSYIWAISIFLIMPVICFGQCDTIKNGSIEKLLLPCTFSEIKGDFTYSTTIKFVLGKECNRELKDRLIGNDDSFLLCRVDKISNKTSGRIGTFQEYYLHAIPEGESRFKIEKQVINFGSYGGVKTTDEILSNPKEWQFVGYLDDETSEAGKLMNWIKEYCSK